MPDRVTEADRADDPEHAADRVVEQEAPQPNTGRAGADPDQRLRNRQQEVLDDQGGSTPAREKALAALDPAFEAWLALRVVLQHAVAVAAAGPPVEDAEEPEPDRAGDDSEDD